MLNFRHIDPALRDEAFELLKTGLTTREVARRLGVSKHFVHYYGRDLVKRDPRALERREKAIAMRRDGVPTVEIAAALGVSKETIWAYTRGVRPERRPWHAKARELRAEGHTLAEIARRIGMSEPPVWRLLHGVPAGPRPKAPPPAPPVPRLPMRVATVLSIVSDASGIAVHEMTGPARFKDYSLARQVVMYLAQRHAGRSYPAIGRALGGRDHTTVLHGVRRVARLVEARELGGVPPLLLPDAIFNTQERRP